MNYIENIIVQARDRLAQHRDISSISGIMVHRVGVDLRTGLVIGYDGPTICDAFIGRTPQWQSVANATGSQNAYTFYVGGDVGPTEYDGKVWQALPFDEIGHHGRQFSASHMGIALIGDFRVRPASKAQWRTAVDLISDSCMLLGIDASQVVGHGEEPGAHGGEKSPGRPGACPGGFLVMDSLRRAVAAKIARWMRHQAFWRLARAGAQLI